MATPTLWPIVVWALTLTTARTVAAATINVPADYVTIQEAIDAAAAGDEVVLAAGTYRELINMAGKAITLRSTDPLDSAVVANTILHGDVDEDGTGNGTVIVCDSSEGPQTVINGLTITGGDALHGGGMRNLDNSSPTVTNCTFTSNTAGSGGGMSNLDNSSPTVTNCSFIDNTASSGGGLYNRSSSSPTVTNCSFVDNHATSGGAMRNSYSNPTVMGCIFTGNTATDGGGMHNDYSSPMVANCTFTGNSASNGGGMHNESHSPTVTNCTFSSNTATYNGGAMRNESGSPTVASCTFASNTAAYNGGAMHILENSSPTVTNCAFTGNEASSGGGMHAWDYSDPTVSNCLFIGNIASSEGGGVYSGSDGSLSVTNCILWGNAPEQIVAPQAATVVSYSIVQGGWAGSSNGGVLDTDPLFMDADGIDDDPLTFEDNKYHLRTDSPAIDAGDNGALAEVFDLEGNPRLADVEFVADTGVGPAPIIDIGAYEHSAIGCLADIADANGPTPDGVIDVFDLLEVLAGWGQCADPCPPHCPGDIINATDDGLDCAVDTFDMLELLASYGNCPDPPGACCIPGSSCETLIRSDCESAGGAFLGADVVCDWLAGFLDTDGDRLSDVQESCAGTNPNDADSDNDGIPDGLELEFGTDPLTGDINSNGIPDWQEDYDGDGLINLEEWIAGTSVNDVDTDSDGTSDHDELAQASEPLDPSDGGLAPDPHDLLSVTISVIGINEYPRGLFAMQVDRHIVFTDGSQSNPFVDTKTITLRRCASYAVRGILLAGIWTIEIAHGQIDTGEDCGWIAETQSDGTIVPIDFIPIWDQSVVGFTLHLPDGNDCGGAVPFHPSMSGLGACIFCIAQPDPMHDPDTVCVGLTQTYAAKPCPQACLDICQASAWQWTLGSNPASIAHIVTEGAQGDSVDVHFELPGEVWLHATNGCCFDQTIPITVISVDLDIDSDNDDGIQLPDGDEDAIELDSPGTIALINSGDWDHDGLPGWVDGMARYPFNDYQESADSFFTPMSLTVDNIPVEAFADAVVMFTYDDSNPADLPQNPTEPWGESDRPPGVLRLWLANGDQLRDYRSVADGGHFVPTAVEVSLPDLGFDPSQGNTLNLFIECVRPSSAAGALITVDVTLDDVSCQDAVRCLSAEVLPLQVGSGQLDNAFCNYKTPIGVHTGDTLHQGIGKQDLVIGARTDDRVHVRIDCSIQPDIPEVRSLVKFICRSLGDGSILDSECAFTGTPPVAEIRSQPHANWPFNHPSQGYDYGVAGSYIVLALDSNGYGGITDLEMSDLFLEYINPNDSVAVEATGGLSGHVPRYRIRPVFSTDSNTAYIAQSILAGAGGLIGPIASVNLVTFLNNAHPSGMPPQISQIEWNDPNLEFAVGASFDSTCGASIPEYVYDANTPQATAISISESLGAALTEQLDILNSSVVADLQASPTQTEFYYTFDYNTDSFVYFDPDGDLTAPDRDVFWAFGRVSMSLTVEVFASRTAPGVDTAVLDAVSISGSQVDLYDWDYMIHNWDLRSMKVQAAYPSMFGGGRGQIYRSVVQFDHNPVLFVAGYIFE